jgi:hypothetical protein
MCTPAEDAQSVKVRRCQRTGRHASVPVARCGTQEHEDVTVDGFEGRQESKTAVSQNYEQCPGASLR